MNGICEVASEYNYDIIISMIDGEDISQIQVWKQIARWMGL